MPTHIADQTVSLKQSGGCGAGGGVDGDGGGDDCGTELRNPSFDGDP